MEKVREHLPTPQPSSKAERPEKRRSPYLAHYHFQTGVLGHQHRAEAVAPFVSIFGIICARRRDAYELPPDPCPAKAPRRPRGARSPPAPACPPAGVGLGACSSPHFYRFLCSPGLPARSIAGSGRGGRAARVFRCPLGRITPIRCRGCDPPPALGTTLDARWTEMLRTRIGLRSPRPGPRRVLCGRVNIGAGTQDVVPASPRSVGPRSDTPPPHAVGPRSYATGAMQDPGCGLRRIHLFSTHSGE